MKLKRVVVTGLGAITPLGKNVPDYWDALLNGVSGSSMITHFDTSKFKTKFACEVKDFAPNDLLDRKEARRMDRFTQFGMVVADEAIADSGLDFEKENPDRIGVIWGSGIGGIEVFEEQVAKLNKRLKVVELQLRKEKQDSEEKDRDRRAAQREEKSKIVPEPVKTTKANSKSDDKSTTKNEDTNQEKTSEANSYVVTDRNSLLEQLNQLSKQSGSDQKE